MKGEGEERGREREREREGEEGSLGRFAEKRVRKRSRREPGSPKG